MISERMNEDIISILVSSRKLRDFHVNFKSSNSIENFLNNQKKYGAANILINNAAVSTLKDFPILLINLKTKGFMRHILLIPYQQFFY